MQFGAHPLVVFDNDDQQTIFSEFDPFRVQLKQEVKEEMKDIGQDVVFAKEQIQIVKEVFEKINTHEIESIKVADKQPQGKVDKKLTVAMRKQQYTRMDKQLQRRIGMYKQGLLEDHDFFKNYAFPLRENKWILQQPLAAIYIKDVYYIHLLMDYKVLLRRHDKTDDRSSYLDGNYKFVIHRPFLSVYFPMPKSMLKLEFMGLICCYEIPYVNKIANPHISGILKALHDCQASILLSDILHRLVLENRSQKSRPFKGDPLMESNDVEVGELKEEIKWEWTFEDLHKVTFTLYVGDHNEEMHENEELKQLIVDICKETRHFQDSKQVGLLSKVQEILTAFVYKKHISTVMTQLEPLEKHIPFTFKPEGDELILKFHQRKSTLKLQGPTHFKDMYTRVFKVLELESYIQLYLQHELLKYLKTLMPFGQVRNRYRFELRGYLVVLRAYYNGDIILYGNKIVEAIEVDLKTTSIETIKTILS